MSRVLILTVCTANICRSPAAAALLHRALADQFPQAVVASAGTQAQEGSPACDISTALIAPQVAVAEPGGTAPHHRSRRVTARDVDAAELILALDRSHRSALATLSPRSRSRTFTLRQAAATAAVVAEPLRAGALPEGAPPLPDDPYARFRWWVAELDAFRSHGHPAEIRARDRLVFDSLDVPDPHVVGYQYHPMAVELIEEGVAEVVASIAAVLDFGTPAA